MSSFQAGLGLLRINRDRPGVVSLDLPNGEEESPRLSIAHRLIKSRSGIDRSVTVRIAFTDDRAKRLLGGEADSCRRMRRA
jgi:hypothetical protein